MDHVTEADLRNQIARLEGRLDQQKTPKSWVRFVPFLSLLVAAGSAVLSIFATVTVADFNQRLQTTSVVYTAAWNCAQYEAWAIARINDGFTDQAIAAMAVRLHVQTTTFDLATGSQEPPPTPYTGTYLPSYGASASVPYTNTPQPKDPIAYTPCGFTSYAQLSGWIAQLRNGRPTTASTRTSPTTPSSRHP